MGRTIANDLQCIGQQHLRRLRTLHEGLARDFGAALSDMLRTAVDVSLAGIDQLTYGQFVYNIETPACFYLLKADPPADRWMLDVEPSIVYPMIDRLLGGGQEDDPPPGRPLSEIELSLAARVVRLFLQRCCDAWKDVFDLKLDVLQTENNPRLLRVLPADEMVILVAFDLAIGQLRGSMRLCLPCRTIEQIGESPAANRRLASGSLAEVSVSLAETPIGAAELVDLRVGDIIATETAADAPAIVSIDHAAAFRAKPGVYRGQKAVQLVEPIDEK